MAAPEVERLLTHDGDLPCATYPEDIPYVYWSSDGKPLCSVCAGRMLREGVALEEPAGEVVAVTFHWEGPPLVCARCLWSIRSAYGIPH